MTIAKNRSTAHNREFWDHVEAVGAQVRAARHKPMLAVDCGGVESLTFPLVISPKLDGVRAVVTADGLMSRALKAIPNRNVQAFFAGLPVGLDGELLVGDPTAPDVYRKTVSVVMSDDKPADGVVFHVFDLQIDGPFYCRASTLRQMWMDVLHDVPSIELVTQVLVKTLDALIMWEGEWVGQGYEGLIARSQDSPYKHGRSTQTEGYLLKVKRFVDGEAEVIGVTELMHNGNEAKTNALGRTERSHKKAGMVPTGTMGTLVAKDVKTGVGFEIGTGFTAQDRHDYWRDGEDVIGKTDKGENIYHTRLEGWLAKYKHFPSGAKDKPRHPVFLGWRDKRDL